MKRIKFLKGFLAALTIAVSTTASAQYNWITSFVTGGSNTGCGHVVKRVSYTNNQNCGVSDSWIRIQRLVGSTWVNHLVQVGGGSGNYADFTITQSGTYRAYVESQPGSDLCNNTPIDPGNSASIVITINTIPIPYFDINGNTASSPTAIPVFLCNAINLNSAGIGTVTQYKLTVQSANASGTATSTYNSNPSGTWTSGAIPATTNLNTGANATAFAAGGYFLITLESQTSTCSSLPRKALINVTTSVATPFANFKINNATPNNCGSPLQTYDCSPITLTNTSTNATSYKVDLFTAPVSCPNGTYSHVHSTGIVNTFPTDAKNLPGAGANGTWLQTHTGYYAIIVTAYNACGTWMESQSLYFNVAAGPTGASAAFTTSVKTKATQTLMVGSCLIPVNQEFTYRDGSTSCGGANGWFQTMEHTSTAVGAPNKVGRTFTRFNFDNISGGTGSFSYTVRIKAESWNGSTWTLMGSDPLGEDLGQAPGSIELEDLVDGAFTDNTLTPNGNIYRITVYVINACGTVSTTQIIQIDDVRLRLMTNDSDLTISEDAASIGLQAYPNPATDEFNFSFDASKDDVVNIALYDLSGRKALDVVEAAKAVEGENNYKSSLNGLSAGSYIYKVQINETVFTGKMIKK